MKTWQKPINLTLRSKVNIASRTWMYVSYLLMVIDPCAKYGRPLSNQKIVMSRTQKHVKNPTNLTLRSIFKVVSGSWMCATYRLWWYIHVPKMVTQCQTKKKVMGRTRKHVKNPVNLTNRSKFKVVSVSWMYATHRLMVIHPCVKYGMPMSNPKQLWAGHKSAQTVGQTEGHYNTRRGKYHKYYEVD